MTDKPHPHWLTRARLAHDRLSDDEPTDGESRDREGGIRPVPPQVDPVPNWNDRDAVTEGDRVRVDQSDRDEPIIGTVAEIRTTWGRATLILDVPDRGTDVVLNERADRELRVLPDDGQTDGGRPMTDGGRPRSLGQARAESQSRQFCGACEAGVEHTAEECDAARTDDEPEIRTDGGAVEEPPGHIGHPEYTPHNVMREWNPDTWDPDPDPDHYKAGEVNVWDPIEGEGFNEPGHWADRDPDMSETHARRLALRGEFDGLGEEQPLPLLSSNMSGVPTEGVQGSFSHVIRLDDACPECGQQWGVHVCHSTMGGVHTERCLMCRYEIARH